MERHVRMLLWKLARGEVRARRSSPPHRTEAAAGSIDRTSRRAGTKAEERRAAMGMIEFGAVRVYLGDADEALAMLQALVRHITNKEAAALLGVSERTVRRWKREGRLPSRHGDQIMLVELLEHLAAQQDTPNTAPSDANEDETDGPPDGGRQGGDSDDEHH